jgi:hypothetical protein
MHVRNDVAEGAAVGVAAVAVAVTYGIYAVRPWQGAPPLNQFLATFGRVDTTAWPMQIVCYAAAVGMVGLALWPARRWSSPADLRAGRGLLRLDRDRVLRLAEPGHEPVRGVGRRVHAAGGAVGGRGGRAPGPGDPAPAGCVLGAGRSPHPSRAG